MSADNIQVAIKARPLLKKEKDSKLSSQWRIVDNSIQLADSPADPFFFDHIFDEKTTNRQIFNTVAKPIVDATLRGFNGTIFAYGQTSSGKTYTMVGDDRNPGVMIMAVQEIFKEIEKATDRAFLLRVGYIEIYNEKIYDLLNKKNQDLKIHETATGEVNVNCTDFIITCEQDMMEHLHTGNKTRKICETNMNERSSRSHAIFRIIIESREFNKTSDETSDETAVQISHLNLVDLAGSERADQSGATGSRLKEGCHINKSLLSLSCVINKLSENEADKYINYRDSKLTRILQASLGGNALTAIICTIKTTVTEETNSTLSFAMRAKSIKNKPHKNEVLSDAAMMKRLAKEIARLENELKVEKNKNSKIKITQIERQIKDAELKIVHSHSVGKDRNTLRRRTWCPTSNTQPPLVSNTNLENIDDATSERELMPPPPMFLTPLITLREHNNFSEEFTPGEEMEFAASDFHHLNPLRTPLKTVTNNDMDLTPTRDIKARYETLAREFEELETFTKLEKDCEKNEFGDALIKIAQLEQERREYLRFADDNHEKTIKLERAKERCLELESRISELNEAVNILEYKEERNESKLREYDQQLKIVLMAAKDVEGIEYEYEKYKENAKFRENELLSILNNKESQILSLEKQLSNTVISTDQKIIVTDQNGSSESFVNKIVVSNSDNQFIDDTTIFTYDTKSNTSAKLQDNKLNRSNGSVISHVNLENSKVDSLQQVLIEKDELIERLNINIEEMQQQNIKLQNLFDELSAQQLDDVYENEKLRVKLSEITKTLENMEKKLQLYEEKEDTQNFKLEQYISKVESVTLKSEMSDEPFNVHTKLEEVEDLSSSTKEHAASLIDEILNGIITEDRYPICQFDKSLSASADYTEAVGNVRYSLPNINSSQSKVRADSTSETLIRDLVEKNKDISIKLKTIEKVNEDLKDSINESEKCRTSLESELEKLNLNIVQLKNENKLLAKKVMDSDEQNRNIELRLNDVLIKLNSLNKYEADTTIIVGRTHSAQFSLLDTQISDLLEKMEEIETTNRNLKIQIENFESKMLYCDGLEKKLNAILLEETEYKKNISQLEDDKMNLTKQLNELAEQIKQINFEKENKTKQFLKLKTDINDQNDFIRRTKIEIDEKESEKSELTEELQSIKSIVQALEKSNKEFKENQEKLSLQLSDNTNIRNNLEKDLQTLTEAKALLQKEVTESQNKNLELTNELLESRTLLHNMEQECRSLKESTKGIAESLQQLQEERDRLKEIKEKLEKQLSNALDDVATEKEKHIGKTLQLGNAVTENVRLTKERDTIIAIQKEQIENATMKVDKLKIELEKRVEEHNLHKKENEEMKMQISKKDNVIRDLHSQLETMVANMEKNISEAESRASKNNKGEIEIELLSLKEEHSKCLNIAKEKEELLKQLHEMQKMHVYKIKQYQQEMNNLTALQKLDQDQNQKSSKTTEPAHYSKLLKTDLNESERQRIIKALIGENDELRMKNQDLTIELQESRKLSQKDRKSKRQSTHDEKRPLIWNDSRDIGTMTDPTDQLCNCERLDKELAEAKKTLRIRDCQVNTILMQSKHNPLKEENEALKRSIEEEEAESKELRRELCKLKNQISGLHKQSKSCDQCLIRSKAVFVNQFSQTNLSNEQSINGNTQLTTTPKSENELSKLQNKYEDLKRICRLRNTRIQELDNKVKENESITDSFSKEIYVLKKKYEEVKLICLYRDKHIQTLEAELKRLKCES